MKTTLRKHNVAPLPVPVLTTVIAPAPLRIVHQQQKLPLYFSRITNKLAHDPTNWDHAWFAGYE